MYRFQYEPGIGKCYENVMRIFVACKAFMMFRLCFGIVMGMSFLHISVEWII